MEWKFEGGQPIYSQIVDQMSMKIASNAFRPGDRLPSVRDLATDAGVNPNTMQRALGELERRGLVFSERTAGRFVTKEEKVLKELHEKLAETYIADFFERLRKIGMTDQEIQEAVTRWSRETGGEENGNHSM